MTIVSRIAVGAVAAFFLLFGLGFWFSLDQTVANFAVSPDSLVGRATIRADFGALFLGVGSMSAIAAFRQNRTYAYGALLLVSIALTGRFVSVFFDGLPSGAVPPMAVEAGSIGILAWARNMWKAG